LVGSLLGWDGCRGGWVSWSEEWCICCSKRRVGMRLPHFQSSRLHSPLLLPHTLPWSCSLRVKGRWRSATTPLPSVYENYPLLVHFYIRIGTGWGGIDLPQAYVCITLPPPFWFSFKKLV
jgi:hypothetical protein